MSKNAAYKKKLKMNDTVLSQCNELKGGFVQKEAQTACETLSPLSASQVFMEKVLSISRHALSPSFNRCPFYFPTGAASAGYTSEPAWL